MPYKHIPREQYKRGHDRFPSIFHTFGGKKLLASMMTQNRRRAERIVETMSKEVEFGDSRAKVAIQAAVEVIELVQEVGEKKIPLYKASERLKAAELILKYTQKLPATDSNVNLHTAEEWLADLADKGE